MTAWLRRLRTRHALLREAEALDVRARAIDLYWTGDALPVSPETARLREKAADGRRMEAKAKREEASRL